MRSPTSLRLAMVAMIVVAAALHAKPATAGGPTDASLGLQPSDKIAGPALIAGRLVDANGAAASAAQLTVIAWPTMTALGHLAAGDAVKTAFVAKGVTGGDGSFILRVDPTISLASYTEADGTINFTLMGNVPGAHSVFAFPRKFDRVSGSWVDPSWRPDRASATQLNVALSLDRAVGAPSGAVPAPRPAYKFCDQLLALYDQRTTVIGEVYTGPNATGQFVYTSSSPSSLGVGYSVGGGFGSFSESGTASQSSTTTLNYPGQPQNALYIPETTFQYGEYAVYNVFCGFDHYEVRPTAFQGAILSYSAASAPYAPYCSFISAGGSATKNTASAISFTNGVDLNVGAVGAYLSSQTGYSSSTAVSFNFVNNGYLCGSDTAYPDASRVVGQ